MRRFTVAAFVLSAATVLGPVATSPAQADEFLWHHPTWPRKVYFRPFHYFGGQSAGLAGLKFHHFASHGSFGSHGSHGSFGSHASFGSHGSHSHGSFASHGSFGSHSHGSFGSWGGHGGSWHHEHGPHDLPPDLPPEGLPAPERATLSVPPGGAGFLVHVPAGAKVFVNGKQTTSTGTQRSYIAREMEPGKSYTFNIRAEFERDGEPVVETKSLKLQSGDRSLVAFKGPAPRQNLPADQVETTLAVRVPAEAKVYLAGKSTTSTGEVRRFVTSKLAAGSEHADFEVRAVLEHEGRQLVQQRKVVLKAGQQSEIEFDFEPQLAQQEPPARERMASFDH